MADPVRRSKGLTGRHVLAIFLGFFGVIFAVNAYFISVAIGTYSGTVANEPYRKGLKYNERIAAAEQQAELGWTDEISITADGEELTLDLRDRDGAPVSGLEVDATLGRPATASRDAALRLEETSPGHYKAVMKLAEKGTYIATLEARPRDGGTILFRLRKRLWVEH